MQLKQTLHRNPNQAQIEEQILDDYISFNNIEQVPK